MVFENCDLRDQALDQRLVKLRDGGGLLPDELLKVSDQPHPLVSNNAVNLGLLSHVPEPEDSRRTSGSQMDGRQRGSRYGSCRKHQGN